MITNHKVRPGSRPEARQTHISRRRLVSVGAVGLSSAVMFGGSAHSVYGQDAGADQVLSLPLYPYGQDILLDPHRASNWGPHWVMLPHVWAGLLRFDEHGAVITDLAASIEPEPDGLVWVAEIRSDATFASGNPVTAEAMIQGWVRALDTQQLAPMAGYMARVDGFDAFIAGESEEIGFEARSEVTVAIQLTEPYAHFPEDLATFVWAAVDPIALEGIPGSQAPFADASAGPWRFAPSEDPSLIRMIPNPNTQEQLPDTFGEVQWRLIAGAQAAESALGQFQEGGIAIADISATQDDVLAQQQEFAEQLQTIQLSGSTMLIGMDFNQAPFNDPRVRQAVAASIDRSAWASDIQGGAFTEATSITPPVLSQSANYAPPQLVAFDPDRARALLVEASIDESTQPPVTYYLPADASDLERDQATALMEMIQGNSGLVIEVDTTLTTDQIQALRSDNGGLQFDLRWWWPLTNSPSGLTQLAGPSSESMVGWFNWSVELENEAAAAAAESFATLAAQASTELDETARVQLYAQAEQILVENAVYVPLGHGVQEFVQAAGLTGTRQGAFTGYAPLLLNGEVTYQP